MRAVSDDGEVRFQLPAGRDLPSKGEVESDLQRLERIRELVEASANKWVAHSDRVGVPTRAPDFAELDRALADLKEVFLKYRGLVTGNDSDRVGPDVVWK